MAAVRYGKYETELRGQLTGTTAAEAGRDEIRAQVQAAAKGGTSNPEAHQLYMQGRFFATRSSSVEVAQGVNYFEQALKLDRISPLPGLPSRGRACGRSHGSR